MRAVRTRTGSPARDCPRVAERSAEEAGFEEQPLTQDPEQPHAVASVERPEGTDTYGYDASGSQTSRTEAGEALAQGSPNPDSQVISDR